MPAELATTAEGSRPERECRGRLDLLRNDVSAWDDRSCAGNWSWREDGRGACAACDAWPTGVGTHDKEVS